MLLERLKEREPTEIALLECPNCGQHSYYNEGSTFYCRHCDRGYTVMGADELAEVGSPEWCQLRPVCCDDLCSLADLIDEQQLEVP